jgi:hypothetical protein
MLDYAPTNPPIPKVRAATLDAFSRKALFDHPALAAHRAIEEEGGSRDYTPEDFVHRWFEISPQWPGKLADALCLIEYDNAFWIWLKKAAPHS